MNRDKFLALARKRLVYDFGGVANAAKSLGIAREKLSHGLLGSRKMPTEVLQHLGYEMNKQTIVTYTKVKT